MSSRGKRVLYTALFGCLVFPAMVVAATGEELEKRLKKLEEAVEANNEETQDLANGRDEGMRVTGYSTLEYVTTDEVNKNSGFRLRHLSLMFNKQVNEDLKFFSEIEFEDAPLVDKNFTATANGSKIMVEAVNFTYTLNSGTTLRAGRFFTPAGLWLIDSIPFVLTQDRPLHIRNIFPHVTDGATIAGVREMGNSFVGYDLFVGNGQTSQFDGNTGYNSSLATGLKVNIALPLTDKFEVGGTAYREKMKVTATAAEEYKHAYGVHFQVRQGSFYVRGEYANGAYDPVAPLASSYHRIGYYVQPSYDIDRWTLAYRHDFYDSNTTTAASSATVENVPVIAYHVDKNTTLKWEHHIINKKDPALTDFYRNIVSVAVNFD